MGGGKRRVQNTRADYDPEDHKMIINQIMLKFRPIAPRPVTVESSVGFVPLKEKKAKRKYVRVKMKKKTKIAKEKKEDECNLNIIADQTKIPREWICFDVSGNKSTDIDFIGRWITTTTITTTKTPAGVNQHGLHGVDLARSADRGRIVESWITVESVIGTCEYARYCTDEEMWKDLERDSCPGFISKGYNYDVQWVNGAYRRMVDRKGAGEVVVRLWVKVERSVFEWWPGFSCRVRVVYEDDDLLIAVPEKKKKKVMTVPCDVWKMNSGGYAWRLDVKAALSLGRLIT